VDTYSKFQSQCIERLQSTSKSLKAENRRQATLIRSQRRLIEKLEAEIKELKDAQAA